jgi:hypothetical protein
MTDLDAYEEAAQGFIATLRSYSLEQGETEKEFREGLTTVLDEILKAKWDRVMKEED